MTRPISGNRNSRNGSNQRRVDRVPPLLEVVDDLEQVGADVVGEHEPVVQLGPPADQRAGVGVLPEPGDEGAHEQRLGRSHLPVRRHLERSQLEQAESAGGGVGGVELVDAELGPVGVAGEVGEQMTQRPIGDPRRRLVDRV